MGKKGKGQAAMEFLMTYGWAILVVLVVIMALAYFGVLSPGRLLPDRCDLPPGFACIDYHVASDGIVSMEVANSLGNPIDIISFYAESPEGELVCGNSIVAPITLPNGARRTMFTLACGPGILTEGEKQRLNLFVRYTFSGQTLEHNLQGNMYTTISAPIVSCDNVDGDAFQDPANPPGCWLQTQADCNDDPSSNGVAIYPGAVEICGNFIDDNCDGVIDETCIPPAPPPTPPTPPPTPQLHLRLLHLLLRHLPLLHQIRFLF